MYILSFARPLLTLSTEGCAGEHHLGHRLKGPYNTKEVNVSVATLKGNGSDLGDTYVVWLYLFSDLA